MKIETITNQHRRDFQAVYVCEHCGSKENGTGYDDDYFHRNVVPAMKCKQCGNAAPSEYRPLGTKYAATEVV
jgi:hypothetical protein